MMKPGLHDIARPGILLSEAAPWVSGQDGETLRAVEAALQSSFFSAVQTAPVRSAAERRQIGEAAASVGATLTYCVSVLQYERCLNPSALDPGARQAAVEAILPTLDEAREQGSTYVMLISGAAPEDPALRAQALNALTDSLDTLCRTAAGEPYLPVLIEPLDVAVHKKGALGYTGEAVALARTLRAEHAHFGLCLDTAHMMLNREDPVDSLRLGRDVTAELHLCNGCLDASHALYGDQHIPLGPPGLLDGAGLAQILAQAAAMGFLNPQRRPGLYLEVRNRTLGLKEVIRQQADTLSAVWDLAQAGTCV